MSKINHFEELCVFNVDFDIWSGQTRLSPEDFKIGAGGEIPPEKIALLGSKKICNPAQLKGFHRLKSDVRRTLLRYGIPFMNGYATPVAKIDEIILKLNAVEAEFQKLKDEFIDRYHQSLDDWCNENPEYASALRAGALPIQTVKKRLGFEYQVIKIGPVTSTAAATERLERKVSGLGDELIRDLTEEADKFFHDRLAGRDRCGITTKKTLRNMRDKLDGLSFLNGKIAPLVDLLDKTLAVYSQTSGREVVAPQFAEIVSTVLILSSEKSIESYLQGVEAVQVEETQPQASAEPEGEAVVVVAAPDPTQDFQDFAAEMDALFPEVMTTEAPEAVAIEAPAEVADVQQEEAVIDVDARIVEKNPEFTGFDDIVDPASDEDSYF